MRGLLCLIFVGACNLVFSANAGPDAQDTEVIRVPSDGRAVVSSTVLLQGELYKLVASGTYKTSVTATGDAEYYSIIGAAPRDLDDPPGLIDVGIGVDDERVDGMRTPRWGAYTDTHIYSVEFQGKGAPITVKLHDGDYANNSGELELTIQLPAM